VNMVTAAPGQAQKANAQPSSIAPPTAAAGKSACCVNTQGKEIPRTGCFIELHIEMIPGGIQMTHAGSKCEGHVSKSAARLYPTFNPKLESAPLLHSTVDAALNSS